jgi:hypothetical protein
MAIEIIIHEIYSEFIILSDSLCTVKNKFNPGVLNQKFKTISTKLLICVNLSLSPGHSGIKGNEIADEQASIAIYNNETFLISQISYGDSKKKKMNIQKVNGKEFKTHKTLN